MKNLIDKIPINLLNLLFPKFCAACKTLLLKNQNVLCASCLHEISMNLPTEKQTQELKEIFAEFKLEFAFYQLNFSKNEISQQLIHQLKYKNRQDIGVYLAEMYLEELNKLIVFNDVDVIIPVPIHKKRLFERGYNQVEKYAQTIAENFNIVYNNSLLFRKKYDKSLTKLNREERQKMLQNTFELTTTNEFKNKHILLIDDVFTTGATLKACLTELKKIENCKISIIAIMHTKLY